MKIKPDENLPARLTHAFRLLGHDVHTVPAENLAGTPDSKIWSTDQAERRFVIRQDLDFSDVRHFRPGIHAGLLLARLPAPGSHALTAMFATEPVETWFGCFVVLSDHKLRVRFP
jgi:Domain of unknown function (DUF5615)